MRILTAAALVLDVFDLHERDRIVAYLTAEHGQRRGVARGARTKFSRFAGQLQPRNGSVTLTCSLMIAKLGSAAISSGVHRFS